MLRRTTISCLAAGALAAAGCGGAGSGGADADPATLVPASASIYLEATVQPEGELREGALTAAGKVLRTADPAAQLQQWIDEGLKEEGLTWERDFAPWLGARAGVWGNAAAAEEGEFAAIIAVADEEAAEAALPRLQEGGTKRKYGDTEYLVDDEGNAAAVVEGFMVVGPESAFKRTLDARDADTLADADRYEDVVGELDEDRLGHYYLDVRALLDAAVKADPQAGEQLDMVRNFLPLDKLGPVAGSFQADGEALAFDQVMTDLPEGTLRELAKLAGGGESELLAAMPADAWAAWAVPDVGASAEQLLGSVAGAIGGVAIAGQVKEATGLDLQADLFAWMGDIGMFVRGSDMTTLDGAVVIESTDDARAASAFGKVVALIGQQAGALPEPVRIEGAEQAVAVAAPDAPQRLVFARGKGRVVLAYGDAAATAALTPSAELGDAPMYGAARESLDDAPPSLVVSVPAVLSLVDALGEADAEFEQARPYLEALDTVAAGGSSDDGTVRSRTAVTLK